MRTASLRGLEGPNFRWKIALERMNLEVATLLGNDKLVRWDSRGCSHPQWNQKRDAVLCASGVDDNVNLNENDGILYSDIATLVYHLKERVQIATWRSFGVALLVTPYLHRSDGFERPRIRMAAEK
jgi:hypothetical protein